MGELRTEMQEIRKLNQVLSTKYNEPNKDFPNLTTRDPDNNDSHDNAKQTTFSLYQVPSTMNQVRTPQLDNLTT